MKKETGKLESVLGKSQRVLLGFTTMIILKKYNREHVYTHRHTHICTMHTYTRMHTITHAHRCGLTRIHIGLHTYHSTSSSLFLQRTILS